jgi:hypothetical protein
VRPVSPIDRPVFRPGVPCETQEPPDLNALRGPGDPVYETNPSPTPADVERMARAKADFDEFVAHLERVAQGEPSVDPLEFSDQGELLQMERLGIKAKRGAR